MSTAHDRLRDYGYELSQPKPPAATYVPVTRLGNALYISGQISASADGPVVGRLGDTMNVVQGSNAAELAAVSILNQIVFSGGVELEAVKRIVKLLVLVNSTPDFAEHHLVANGASNLLVNVLGERGKHARSAIGVAALPLGAAVEVEAIVEIA